MAKQSKAKTVRDIIIARRIRKGASDGITTDGAYWLADTARHQICSEGGDGIGWSAADIGWYINIRHYRNGEVRCYLSRHTWHQNSGTNTDKTRADNILDATTIEEVIQLIHNHKICYDYSCGSEMVQLSSSGCEELEGYLPELPLAELSPDDAK